MIPSTVAEVSVAGLGLVCKIISVKLCVTLFTFSIKIGSTYYGIVTYQSSQGWKIAEGLEYFLLVYQGVHQTRVLRKFMGDCRVDELERYKHKVVIRIEFRLQREAYP